MYLYRCAENVLGMRFGFNSIIIKNVCMYHTHAEIVTNFAMRYIGADIGDCLHRHTKTYTQTYTVRHEYENYCTF